MPEHIPLRSGATQLSFLPFLPFAAALLFSGKPSIQLLQPCGKPSACKEPTHCPKQQPSYQIHPNSHCKYQHYCCNAAKDEQQHISIPMNSQPLGPAISELQMLMQQIHAEGIRRDTKNPPGKTPLRKLPIIKCIKQRDCCKKVQYMVVMVSRTDKRNSIGEQLVYFLKLYIRVVLEAKSSRESASSVMLSV